jgi:hypothetical protein
VSEHAAASDLVALITRVCYRVISQQRVPLEGVIVPGSYNKTNGTVEVILGHTDSIPQGMVAGPLSHPILKLLTPINGLQGGPRGGERCLIIPRGRGNWGVTLDHWTDDSPGADAGENWYVHKNASGAIDGWTKHTNDGPTGGDGLGGINQQGGALHVAGTGGGHSIEQNDTTKTVTAKSAGGHKVTLNDAVRYIQMLSKGGHNVLLDDAGTAISIVSAGGLVHKLDDANQQITHVAGQVEHILDGAGNTISHIVPTGGILGLGSLASTLSAENNALNVTHLGTYETNRKAANLADLIANANLMHTAGIANSGQLATMLASLVAGFTNAVAIPSGSAKVRLPT